MLEMTVANTGFKRLARTFDITLYTTLHKLMSLKSDILSGLLIFGIRAI